MTMTMPENQGGDFTPPPEGTHVARCYRVVDLGTQQVEYMGDTKRQHKVLVSWELPTEPMEDGRPFTIHNRYTFSSSEKSHFRQHLESWRGRKFEDKDFGEGGFEIRNLIGVPCLLSVVHNHKNGKTYDNVQGVMRLMKGVEVPDPINEQAFLCLNQGEFDSAVFDQLSDGLKETIRRSPEYQKMFNGMPATHDKLPPAAPVPSDGGAPIGPIGQSPTTIDDEIPF